jgi:hypothetical protein
MLDLNKVVVTTAADAHEVTAVPVMAYPYATALLPKPEVAEDEAPTYG